MIDIVVQDERLVGVRLARLACPAGILKAFDARRLKRDRPFKTRLTMTPPAIPRDRPVLGKDLITFQSRLQCSAQDCCCLLGIPSSTWSAWKHRPDDPIPSVTVALAIRLYDQRPELAVRHPTPEELRALLEQITGRPFPRTLLSVLLGRERTSGYRWTRRGRPSTRVVALIAPLIQLLKREGLEALDAYRALVEAEASERGVKDIWTTGIWSSEKE
jgi:hypothetical protein